MALVIAAAVPAAGVAQQVAPLPLRQWELRADGIFGSSSAGHLGAGVNVPAGDYTRVGVVVASGPARRLGRTEASARADFVARYLLYPFGEMRWGLYAGGGFTTVYQGASRLHGYLLAEVGVEGPPRGGWRPAFELALGGGFRAGVVLRRARSNAR